MQGIDEALTALLRGDVELMVMVAGVHNTTAPYGAGYPQVLFQQISAVDEYTLSGLIATTYSYQIRVIGRGLDKEALNYALEHIDYLLMDTVLTPDTIYCRREGEMPNMSPEMDAGVLYQQVGATYRIEENRQWETV